MNINHLGQNHPPINLQSGKNLPASHHSKSDSSILSHANPVSLVTSATITSSGRHSMTLEPKPTDDVSTIVEMKPYEKPINLRSISRVEIGTLIRANIIPSGQDLGGALDVMPYWENRGSAIYSSVQSDGHAQDQNIDFLAKIENAIESKQALKQPTDLLQSTLEMLKRIDGKAMPGKLDLLT